MRTSRGLIVGAVAIAIGLSGALVALLSLGPAVNFDDWPRPPQRGGGDVRPGATAGPTPAAGLRRADARSLDSLADLSPDAIPAGGAPAATLLTVDAAPGADLAPAFQRRQVARPRPPRQPRTDSVAPRTVPGPVAPAPSPAPRPAPTAPVEPPAGDDEKPGKGGGDGGPRPTTPGRGRPGGKPEPQPEGPDPVAPKPDKPDKPDKPPKPDKPDKPDKSDKPRANPGAIHRSDSRNRVFRGTHRVVPNPR